MIPSALSKAISESPNFNTIIVSTGNILNNEIGRKSNEELYDGLQLALEYGTTENDEATGDRVELFESEGKILRATEELKQKLTENERPAISIGAKLFLNKITPSCSVEQAIKSTLQILNVENLDNLVVAYHPNAQTSDATTTTTTETPKTPCAESTAGGGGSSAFSWSARNPGTAIGDLKILYTSLEDFALQKQVLQLGVADLDAETLKQLCVSARVPPTIAQINLSACCVVPQELKDFCNANDIQLLTHGDPEMLLSDEDFQKALPGYELDWALRYQVHVRCRGLLSAKGYIIGATKILQDNKPSDVSLTSYKSA